MGGYGSGRPREHAIVEHCHVLSVDRLVELGFIGQGLFSSGSICWTNSDTGEEKASIGLIAECGQWLQLRYVIGHEKTSMDYNVGLTRTRPHLGGVRWWFVCPAPHDGVNCMRRCGKLYLPPGENYFACRHCHHLTYWSCRNSHKGDAWMRLYGPDLADGDG